VKYFIKEDGTEEMQKFILKESSIGTNMFSASAVTYAEMLATLRRSLEGDRVTEDEYDQAVLAFKEQWENIDIPGVNDLLIKRSGALAQKYRLKGCDAFQLASALAIRADVFVNSDDDLRNAVKDCGFTTWDPVHGEFSEISYVNRTANVR
jgi:predicted nucleic acid-binding protein